MIMMILYTEIYLVKLMKIIANQKKSKVLLMLITANMKEKKSKIKMYCLKNILILSDLSSYDK